MGTRSRWVALLLLFGLVLGACGEPTEVPKPAEGEQVAIARVLDGDTAELDDGRRVRYVGINTPERGQPFYEEATEANRRLAEGKDAWLAVDTQPIDKYGRLLAYIWVGDQFVNLERQSHLHLLQRDLVTRPEPQSVQWARNRQ